MSAFICTDKHIAAMAWMAARDYGYGSPKIDRDEYKENFIQLYRANVASVNYRYNETTSLDPERIPEISLSEPCDEVQLIKLCHCWEYQSCEIQNYQDSEGYKVMERALKNACKRLPGYADADWGF